MTTDYLVIDGVFIESDSEETAEDKAIAHFHRKMQHLKTIINVLTTEYKNEEFAETAITEVISLLNTAKAHSENLLGEETTSEIVENYL